LAVGVGVDVADGRVGVWVLIALREGLGIGAVCPEQAATTSTTIANATVYLLVKGPP
jgi:hypothetical protein